MKRLTLYLSAIAMLSISAAWKQHKKTPVIQWSVAAQLPASSGQASALGFAGPVCGVHKEVLIVAGGANFPDSMPWLGGKKKYYDEIFVFQQSGSQLMPLKGNFKLPAAVAYAAVCSTPSGVFFAGGENANGISNKAYLLQWNESQQQVNTISLPDFPIAITNAAATTNGNMVYVAGGETIKAASALFYAINLNHPEEGWTLLPSIPVPVSHTVLVMPTNDAHSTIYLVGGRKKNANGISDLYANVYAYNLETNQWLQKQSMPYALSAGTGVCAGNNQLLLFGGDKGETFHKTEILLAAIAAASDEEKKKALIQEKNQLQSTHPGFSKSVLYYEIEKNHWKIIDQIPFEVGVTTTAVLWKKSVYIPSGEIKAGVRTPQILEGKFYSGNQ